jgi:hypothetical protein
MDERFALFSYLAQMAVDTDSSLERFSVVTASGGGLRGRLCRRSAHDPRAATGGMDFALKFAASRRLLKLFFAR